MTQSRIKIAIPSILLILACDPGADDPSGADDVARSGNSGPPQTASAIGQEISTPNHFEDGDEFDVPIGKVVAHGGALFSAQWTIQEGGGRPLTTGTGGNVHTPGFELTFPRNFNRISAPDSNSCAGCHNAPFVGGGGDFVANVFVLGQRFDFATFDPADPVALGGSRDETGELVTLQTIANERNTLSMNGSGYIEMLSRQMTEQLQTIRDGINPGESAQLVANGVEFGVLSRDGYGEWDASAVEGLSAQSLRTDPPNLIVRPFHQAGAVVSLREFTNNAMNHHHGIQTTERFGFDTDPDGDGFTNEMSVADVTATSIWQATLSVPGFVIPKNAAIENAIINGAEQFMAIGCADCHQPFLTLGAGNANFSEPNPFNPPGNLQADSGYEFTVNLNSGAFPGPRNRTDAFGNTRVWAFTDLKLHDITSGPDDPNREPLDMQQPGGSDAFFAGNSRFLTRKLWGIANEAPFYHHGKFTTMRQAVLAHAGEADASRAAFEGLDAYGRDSIIEFLKTMQVLPDSARSRVVDENLKPRKIPDALFDALGG